MFSRPRAARWLIVTLALSLSLVFAAGALAADSEAQAWKLLDQGEAAAAGGHFDQAQSLWQKALELKPGWAKAKARLKELPARRKAWPAHKAELMLAERRRQARLDLMQGTELFNQGQYWQAMKLFERYLEVFPEDKKVADWLETARGLQLRK